MIPKELTIEGLYSYQKRQTIDFTNLTSSGLFGIFGATGSGKSSILEAISYALYGMTERLNQKDKRSYNMMNLKSDRSYIAFDFYNHENDLFRAEREFKRNFRNFEDIRNLGSTFYKFDGDDWIPTEHSDAEDIIELSYVNFKRTIIIPQGQFKEFLELSSTERTRMMKDIFQLHRYDLQDKVSTLNTQNNSELHKLEGRLKGYESINAKEIEIKRTALKGKKSQLTDAKQKYAAIDEKFQCLKYLKAQFEDLKQKKASFIKLKEKQKDIKEAKKRLLGYERTYKIFYHLLKDLEKHQKELRPKQNEQKAASLRLNELKKQLTESKAKLEEITPYYEKLDQKKKEEDDLKSIINILVYSSQIKKLKKRTTEEEKTLNENRVEKKEVQGNINKVEKKIASLKSKKLDSKLLRRIGSWFQKLESLEEEQKKQTRKVESIRSKIRAVLDKLAEAEINAETFENEINQELEKLNEQKQEFEIKKNSLNVQKSMSEHANELHNGKPCPLCGALEHPNIVVADDVSEELKQVIGKLKDIENKKARIRKWERAVGKKLDQKRNLTDHLESEQEQLKEIARSITDHRSNFKWEAFDAEKPGEFQAKQHESEKSEEQIEAGSEHLKELRKQEEKAHKKVEECREALEKHQSEENRKQAQIDSNKDNLKSLDFVDYRQKSVEEVKDIQEGLMLRNQEVKRKHESLKNEIGELKSNVASKKKELQLTNKRIEEINSSIISLQKQVDKSLLKEETGSIQTVKEILAREINVNEERQRIQSFYIEFETRKNNIEDLEKTLNRESFSEELFSEEKAKWERSEKELQDLNDEWVKLKDEVERLDKRFREKQELLKQYEKLEKRAKNIKIMLKMFYRAGFVEYVSSMRLRQLCDHANVRFHCLTRNQLSLQLDENNNFEIIDYLNEGRSRSVKTLSGGQLFQVSLSLALALAESVQSNAEADKNFFFIDEGFGTQDSESVNIIFETLLNLNRENKIVGIISHVEELKDRIPMSLMIEKDEEKGSLVLTD